MTKIKANVIHKQKLVCCAKSNFEWKQLLQGIVVLLQQCIHICVIFFHRNDCYTDWVFLEMRSVPKGIHADMNMFHTIYTMICMYRVGKQKSQFVYLQNRLWYVCVCCNICRMRECVFSFVEGKKKEEAPLVGRMQIIV